MALIEALRNFFSPKQEPVVSPAMTTLADILAGKINLTPEMALGHPAVWRAVNTVSTDVAKVPVALYQRARDGSRQLRNGSVTARIIRERPAPGITGFAFRRTLTAHALLYGNGFALVSRNASGLPSALTILNPSKTKLADVTAAGIVWETEINDEKAQIQDADMLHVYGFSHDGVVGANPMELLRDAIALELGVLDYAHAFFKHGFSIRGFIKPRRPLQPEEINRIREALKRQYSGTGNAHTVGILSQDLDFETLAAEPSKTQLVESRDAGLRAIANVFGLPPHKLGDPTRTSYASIEAENTDYLQTTLDQWLVAWEAELNNKLLTRQERDNGFYFEHIRNAIVRTQLKERVEAYAKLVEIGVMSPNEVRVRENLNKRENGDEYFHPANWIPESQSGTGDASGQN